MFSSRPRLTGVPVLLLAFVCGSALPLAAQVLYGSLVGNVTDSTGSAVPGAIVAVTSAETGASHETTTDGTGSFSFTTAAIPSASAIGLGTITAQGASDTASALFAVT